MGFGTLINDIVYKISGRVLSSSGLYTPSDYQYDYAIGGTPFLSSTSDTRPDLEGPVEQRKQQFDAFKDPGEYSLNQWWLRSQTSFVGGAGVIYQDPDTQGEAKNIRFKHSIGVDPFSDPDNLQLLRETTNNVMSPTDIQNGGAAYVAQFTQTDDDIRCWVAKGATVWMGVMDADGMETPSSSITIPTNRLESYWSGGIATLSDSAPTSGSATSEYAFLPFYGGAGGTVISNGIWRIANGFPPMSAVQAYNIGSTSIVDSTIAAARGLLAFGLENNFYMLDPYVTGAALPAPNATVPVGQLIVGIADGPDAVYVAANSRYGGFIYKSTFSALGVVNGLTLTAVLPAGEQVNSIAAYVNTFLVITTTTGVRVGSFAGDTISYGPNLIPVPRIGALLGPECGSGFGRIAFYGTNAYITTQGTAQHDGSFGIMAINLGTLINDTNTGASFNAYSTWIYLPGTTTPIDDITVTLDGRIVSTTGRGLGATTHIEHSVNKISTGYLDTGRCRFNTVEPKLFKYMSIRTPSVLEGEIMVSIIDQNDGVTTYQTFGPTLSPGTNDISTPVPAGPQNWISLRFTLRRGAVDPTIGAKLDSWQIKALPGTLKQRMIVRNFLCFNQEKDKAGQLIAGDTLALDRLTAVRQMCQRGDTVTFQDLVNNISDQVVIDDYQFTMMAPPGPNGENYGGYLTLHLRTVADNVPPLSFAGVDVEN